MRKYIIILTCLCAVALVLGVNANLTYDDFNAVAEYFESDVNSIQSEVQLIKKIGAWISVYSLDYDVDLIERDSGGVDYVDYIFIPPEETPNGNGMLTLVIDSYDKELGIYSDLRRIGNMFAHDAIPTLPEDPDISDVIVSIGSGVRTIIEGIRYFSGLIYALLIIVLHSLPMIIDILRCLMYLLGISSTI